MFKLGRNDKRSYAAISDRSDDSRSLREASDILNSQQHLDLELERVYQYSNYSSNDVNDIKNDGVNNEKISHGRNAHYNNNKNQSVFGKFNVKVMISIAIGYLLMIILGSVGYLTLRQQLKESSYEKIKLDNQIINLTSYISYQQIKSEDTYSSFQNQLYDQKDRLKSLSNLSNAHVLLELQNTKSDLKQSIFDSQNLINLNLQVAQSNIANQINSSKFILQDMLTQTTYSLLQTQYNVTQRLNENRIELNRIISVANNQIREAQYNVSQQLVHSKEVLIRMVDLTNTILQQEQQNFTDSLSQSRAELNQAMVDTNSMIEIAQNNVTAKLAFSALEFKTAVDYASEKLGNVLCIGLFLCV